MSAAPTPLGVPRRWPQPWRGLLHALLLRGLRPPRAVQGLASAQGSSTECRFTAFKVRGARGQTLAAWLALPAAACAESAVPVVVAVHGWGANGATLSPMVEPLVRAGLAVVLFDAANHGQSSTETFSSLPRFAEDLATVIDALREFPAVDAERVALLGHSVGAAAVLLHTARRGAVRAVISLSAFAHPREVMERWLREHHLPRRWIGTAILNHVQEVIGDDFDRIAPLYQLPHLQCPVFLVHGAADTIVPLADAHRLHAALNRGELLVVDGGHDLRAALPAHATRLVDFLASHLAPLPAVATS